jgi:Uma2 family endonuclease
MDLTIARHRFSVEDYHAMGRAGILTEDDRVELIEGEIVAMSPVGSRHMACVNRLSELFHQHLPYNGAIVSVQNPIRLSRRSEPEPDVALLKRRADFYEAHPPGPADVLLLVEVADTSASTDRTLKLPLYAHHGIAEVWLVVIEAQQVEVYRQPSAQGYGEMQVRVRGEALSVLAFPDIALPVDHVLG